MSGCIDLNGCHVCLKLAKSSPGGLLFGCFTWRCRRLLLPFNSYMNNSVYEWRIIYRSVHVNVDMSLPTLPCESLRGVTSPPGDLDLEHLEDRQTFDLHPSHLSKIAQITDWIQMSRERGGSRPDMSMEDS